MNDQTVSTQAQHTPGPWYAVHQDVRVGTPDAYTDIAMAWGGDGERPPYDQMVANARLIAAAPELYAALEVLLMACPVKEGGSAHRQATEALAKARGEVASS